MLSGLRSRCTTPLEWPVLVQRGLIVVSPALTQKAIFFSYLQYLRALAIS